MLGPDLHPARILAPARLAVLADDAALDIDELDRVRVLGRQTPPVGLLLAHPEVATGAVQLVRRVWDKSESVLFVLGLSGLTGENWTSVAARAGG